MWDRSRVSWHTNGQIKDEDCAGFEPNPEFKGEFNPTPLSEPICSRCAGKRHFATDLCRIETCQLCMGSGAEPQPMLLAAYEQNTLESGTTHSGRQDTAGHPFIRAAETLEQSESIQKLSDLGLVVLRSVCAAGNATAYLLENTMKGESVMRQNWKVKKSDRIDSMNWRAVAPVRLQTSSLEYRTKLSVVRLLSCLVLGSVRTRRFLSMPMAFRAVVIFSRSSAVPRQTVSSVTLPKMSRSSRTKLPR